MATHILFIAIDLHIPHAQSLKDKRQQVRSLKDRLQSKFNASVAEIDALEEWQKSIIGMTMISVDKRYLESQSQQVEQVVLDYTGLELIKLHKEWL